MKTDIQLYKLFSVAPEALKRLLKLEVKGEYNLRSEALKDMSRTVDGCFEGSGGPTFLIEFQAQKFWGVYDRAVQVLTTFRLQKEREDVSTILLFLSEAADPKTEPWYSFRQAGKTCLQVLYLEVLLADLAEAEPGHPLIPVFRPLIAREEAEIKATAANDYRRLKESSLPDNIKRVFLEVQESWLMARFKDMTKKELHTMFGVIGDIEESVAYQEIKKEGRDEGLEEGLERGMEKGMERGRASLLLELMVEKFGRLPEWAQEKLGTGKNGELLQWGRNLMKAQDIEDVFR